MNIDEIRKICEEYPGLYYDIDKRDLLAITEIYSEWNDADDVLIPEYYLFGNEYLISVYLSDDQIKNATILTGNDLIVYLKDKVTKFNEKFIADDNVMIIRDIISRNKLNVLPRKRKTKTININLENDLFKIQSKRFINELLFSPINKIKAILVKNNINFQKAEKDELINLAQLFNYYEINILPAYDDILKPLKDYILNDADIDTLILLAGPDSYKYKPIPWGRIQLIYGLLTGFFKSNIIRSNPNNMYNYVKSLPIEKIRNMNNLNKKNDQSPYIFACNLMIMNPNFQILIDNPIEKVIDDYGIIVPPEKNPTNYVYDYFDIYDINKINRPDDIIPLPDDIEDYDYETLMDIFDYYSDRELLEKYPIHVTFENRNDLIGKIFLSQRGEYWNDENDRCENDDTYNVEQDKLHGEVDKDDFDDPTFSYGTYNHRNCYQQKELEQAFMEDTEGEFHFYIPDAKPTDINKEFPAKKMNTLLDFADGELYDKVVEGLKKINIIQKELDNTIQIYNSFNEKDKQWATIFLVWLFIFSMWVRFWRGPGNPYPHETESGEYCTPIDRDTNVNSQLIFYEYMMEKVSSQVKNWIQLLPLIKLDWNKPNDPLSIKPKGTLYYLLNEIKRARACEGSAGDDLSQTAYSLINSYFKPIDVANFNLLINTWSPIVYALDNHLTKTEYPDNIVQEPFDPYAMKYTRHV